MNKEQLTLLVWLLTIAFIAIMILSMLLADVKNRINPVGKIIFKEIIKNPGENEYYFHVFRYRSGWKTVRVKVTCDAYNLFKEGDQIIVSI